MKTEMSIPLHFVESNVARATNPYPHYHQIGSQHANKSDKRKQRRERREKAVTTTSQDVGSGEDCTIYKDEGSTKEEDDNKESNKAEVKILDQCLREMESALSAGILPALPQPGGTIPPHSKSVHIFSHST
jgi:hypothetical protein